MDSDCTHEMMSSSSGSPGDVDRLLSIEVFPSDRGTAVELAGEIDLATRSAFGNALCGLVKTGERITVDLTDVTLLDAGGFALAREMQRRARDHGCELTFSNPRGIVVRVLEILDPDATLTGTDAT
jgi:anti-anti-sigma factor